MVEQVEDPLKQLSEVPEPDPRHAQLGIGLAGIHASLTVLVLADRVPVNVRQLFETAKNVALYSWFVYRFHQVAELVAYSALELALKERAGFMEGLGADAPRPPGLKALLERAIGEGWLKNDNFASWRGLATEHARMSKIARLIQEKPDQEGHIVDDPTEEEIAAAIPEIDMVQILLRSVPLLRNQLAHGSSTLSPRSLVTLTRISEAINQLFADSR